MANGFSLDVAELLPTETAYVNISAILFLSMVNHSARTQILPIRVKPHDSKGFDWRSRIALVIRNREEEYEDLNRHVKLEPEATLEAQSIAPRKLINHVSKR